MGPKCLLFVYGMLKPGHSPPKTIASQWEDAVKGRLYDLGEYPALVELDKAETWVEGFTLEVSRSELPLLDDFEDVESGEYVRRIATSREGHDVYVYEYALELPAGARPITSWPANS